jgi:hypothetical protein
MSPLIIKTIDSFENNAFVHEVHLWSCNYAIEISATILTNIGTTVSTTSSLYSPLLADQYA